MGTHRANDFRTLLVVQLWDPSGRLRSRPASLGLSRSSRLERDCIRDLAKKSGTLAGSGTIERAIVKREPFLLILRRRSGDSGMSDPASAHPSPAGLAKTEVAGAAT
jgi:hypothetical protein